MAFETPQRPSLPGAFLQTPAAPRIPPPAFQLVSRPPQQQNTSTSQQIGRPGEAPARPEAPKDVTPSDRARDTINESLTREKATPPLDEYLSQGYSSEYEINSTGAWTPFQRTRTYRFPNQIFDQYNRAELSTGMGLFAELNHAWVSIDNALYLWDYTVPNPQLVGFEEQSNNITAVTLARPKEGVFLPSITHLIVVATTAEIFLLGLGKEASQNGGEQLALFQTGMAVSIKGLNVSAIASSTKSGRIFFGGTTENHVYELQYQNEERWFLGRCVKKNHTFGWSASFTPSFAIRQRPTEYVEQMVVDDTRSLLWTLSSESAIRCFHMTPDGGLNLTINCSSSRIYENVSHILPASQNFNSRNRIVSISTISGEEGLRFHLVAVTQNGYRIFLSATRPGGWGFSSDASSPPTSMGAQHVKLPPAEDQGSRNSQLENTGRLLQYTSSASLPTRAATRYAPGYFFFLDSRSDRVCITTIDPGLLPRRMTESQPPRSRENTMWVDLGGRAEYMGQCQVYEPPFREPQGFANELAVQFDKKPVEVAILTNNGVHVLRRRRLVDSFAQVYREGGGDEGRTGELRKMVRVYGREETLTTALAVACGLGVEFANDVDAVQVRDPDVLAFARTAFIELGGKPTVTETLDPKNPIDTVKPSPRHDAIATFVSRILRSTWKTLIAKEQRTSTGIYSVVSSIPMEKLRMTAQNLASLSDFFKTNRNFIDGLSGPDETRAATRQEEVALQGENRALNCLVKLVEKAIEALNFVQMMFEERVEELLPLLAEPTRPLFLRLTYEALFTSEEGFKIAKELVKAIVNRNIAKGSNVETVAETLRRRCGQFCSADDVVIFKAQELLKRATEAGGDSEYGRNLLNESLILFQSIAGSLPWDYLESTVKQYTALQFFAGALELILRITQSHDPTGEAEAYVRDGMPGEDGRKTYYDYRQQCYDLVHDVVNTVDQISTTIQGRQSLTGRRKDEAYDIIATSNDRIFLTNLYDWYLSQGWTDRLLATDSAFIVPYLEKKEQTDPAHADLLWQYYSGKRRPHDAARVQLQLAKSGFHFSLAKRIGYLSQANTNVQTQVPGANRRNLQILRSELTEFLDVANLQDDLLQRLRSESRLVGEERIQVLGELDGPVQSATELYNKYLHALPYHDLNLLLYAIADYRLSTDIATAWELYLETLENEASADSSVAPWELIANSVRDLYPRLISSSPVYFPLIVLLPRLLRRDHTAYRAEGAPQHWILELFLSLSPPLTYESIFAVLETMYYSNEAPFVGAAKRELAAEIVALVGLWYERSLASIGRGGVGAEALMGGREEWNRVEELCQKMIEERVLGQEERGVVRRVREGVGRYGW
ncbi:MAG: hypothetical protein Q9227_007842 [Pyrenula ochraceoflavens]